MTSRLEKPVIQWLRDAHAMETAQLTVLEHHARDAKTHPEMQARIEEHRQETRRQADLLEGCLKRHGESTSGLKSAMGQVAGFFKSISTAAAKDELVKNCLADYAAEHFEIACYKSLISAAQAASDHETARICEQILQEEQRMATWLEQNIPMVTQEHMAKVAAA
jgi:ferritin-like metal-binding protein YciE